MSLPAPQYLLLVSPAEGVVLSLRRPLGRLPRVWHSRCSHAYFPSGDGDGDGVVGGKGSAAGYRAAWECSVHFRPYRCVPALVACPALFCLVFPFLLPNRRRHRYRRAYHTVVHPVHRLSHPAAKPPYVPRLSRQPFSSLAEPGLRRARVLRGLFGHGWKVFRRFARGL